MAAAISNPEFSFVRFNEDEDFSTCSKDAVDFCLPVFNSDDVAFQFYVETDYIDEADQLCNDGENLIEVGLADANDNTVTLVFNHAYKPVVTRIGQKLLLVTWEHGFPGFYDIYAVGECFRIRIDITTLSGLTTSFSNCFQRIAEDCYTSVVEYGGLTDQFDFHYCDVAEAGGGVVGDGFDYELDFLLG